MIEDEDSDIVFGTPLEPLDADELPTKRPVQLQDQKVYDENGLQRFHGAFTGGFSAGYFNTVGTKEGWAPTTFVSSRSQKFGRNVQRPEDFMDAEDLREHGIAPMRVQATEQYRKENKKSKPAEDSLQTIPGIAPLADIIRPVSESMGVILLRKLGWRPGQGIGPKRKGKVTKNKVYGCALPSESDPIKGGSDGEDSEDEIASSFLFSPRDVTVLPYKPKDNVYGLDYKPLDSSELSSVSAMLAGSISGHVGVGRGKKKVAFRGQAFGVGAFEDEDEDIYTKDDLTRYDFVLGGEDKPEEERRKKDEHASAKLSASIGIHLAGFVASSQELNLKKKHFPPPELPKGYIPKSKTSPSSPQLVEISRPKIGKGRFLNRFAISAVDRTNMLGNRFQDVKATEAVGKTESEHGVLSTVRDRTIETSRESKPVTTSMEWDNKEKEAVLKFPTVLSTKFVSSAVLEEEETAYGLSRPSTSVPKPADQENPSAEEHKCQRLIEEWHPASLLCKRFNVPDPFPQTTSVGTLSAMAMRPSSQKPSIFRSLFEMPVSTSTEPEPSVQPLGSEENLNIATEESVTSVAETETEWKQQESGAVGDQAVEEDLQPPSPPTMDLFKAIFQDSSSDNDEDEEQMLDDTTERPMDSSSSHTTPSIATDPSPTKVWDNKETDISASVAPLDTVSQEETGSCQFYGPALPPASAAMVKGSELTVQTKRVTLDDKELRRGTKRKKSHHKKHKKHKRKKIKYNKSHRDQSASDSNSSDDLSGADDNQVNFKLIKRLKELKKTR